MMKKLLCLSALMVVSNLYAADFSGTYQCDNSYDSRDGKYSATITLKLNNAYEHSNSPYATYDFSMKAVGYAYPWTGIAAANGSNLAIYFESIGPKAELSDKGIGIATVIMDKDEKGNDMVSLHKFFYEKAYKGKSDYGFENCVLIK